MSTDIHIRPYDHGTLAKLKIFELYLEEWIPVFIKTPSCKEVNIIDFFAGSGTDSKGSPGSPLLIIEVLSRYKKLIVEKNLKVNVIVNERKKDKFKKLSDSLDSHKDGQLFNIVKYNKDFNELFDEIKNSIKNSDNLIFIDQYGVKQVTQGKFIELCNFKRTDFIFFTSSSYVKRFNKRPEFKKHLGWMGQNTFDDLKPHEVHGEIANRYRSLVSNMPSIRVIPFTIKKDKNVFGLVFCSGHIRGAEKFLNVAWKINSENGTANFDIDDDQGKAQGHLWESRQLKKLEKFEIDLELFVLNKSVATNKEIYDYTISCGFLPKHASDVMRRLRDEGKVEHFSHPLIGYQQCYAEGKEIQFKRR